MEPTLHTFTAYIVSNARICSAHVERRGGDGNGGRGDAHRGDGAPRAHRVSDVDARQDASSERHQHERPGAGRGRGTGRGGGRGAGAAVRAAGGPRVCRRVPAGGARGVRAAALAGRLDARRQPAQQLCARQVRCSTPDPLAASLSLPDLRLDLVYTLK